MPPHSQLPEIGAPVLPPRMAKPQTGIARRSPAKSNRAGPSVSTSR